MTNPMTMVERVADALSTVTTGPNAGDLVISQIFSDELWAIMSDRLACAAIAAMRLPSDEDFGGKYGTEPRRLFSEMIDTALSEHKTQTRKG